MVLPASRPAHRTARRFSAVIFKLHSNLSRMMRTRVKSRVRHPTVEVDFALALILGFGSLAKPKN